METTLDTLTPSTTTTFTYTNLAIYPLRDFHSICDSPVTVGLVDPRKTYWQGNEQFCLDACCYTNMFCRYRQLTYTKTVSRVRLVYSTVPHRLAVRLTPTIYAFCAFAKYRI